MARTPNVVANDILHGNDEKVKPEMKKSKKDAAPVATAEQKKEEAPEANGENKVEDEKEETPQIGKLLNSILDLPRGLDQDDESVTAVYKSLESILNVPHISSDVKSGMLKIFDRAISRFRDPVIRRINHLITYSDRKTVNNQKVKWIPRIANTIQFFDLLAQDPKETNKHAYIKLYPEGFHFVIVDERGEILDQTGCDYGLITQYPELVIQKKRLAFVVEQQTEPVTRLSAERQEEEDIQTVERPSYHTPYPDGKTSGTANIIQRTFENVKEDFEKNPKKDKDVDEFIGETALDLAAAGMDVIRKRVKPVNAKEDLTRWDTIGNLPTFYRSKLKPVKSIYDAREMMSEQTELDRIALLTTGGGIKKRSAR